MLHSSAVPNRSETDVVGEQRLLALMNASASVAGGTVLSAIGLLGFGLLGCGSGFWPPKNFC